MADSVLGISQAKSLFQLICGDVKGAKKTQDNFTKQCLGVSQLRSVVEVIAGDQDAALNTQKEFVRSFTGKMDGKPGFGHIKGALQYAIGDKEGGANAMRSATRQVGKVVGGVIGMFVGGPMGAYAGGMSGGLAIDTLIYAVESAFNGKAQLSGTLEILADIFDNPNDPGKLFDAIFLLKEDADDGHKAGKKHVKDPKAQLNVDVTDDKRKKSKKKQKRSNQKESNPKEKQHCSKTEQDKLWIYGDDDDDDDRWNEECTVDDDANSKSD